MKDFSSFSSYLRGTIVGPLVHLALGSQSNSSGKSFVTPRQTELFFFFFELQEHLILSHFKCESHLGDSPGRVLQIGSEKLLASKKKQ